MKTGKNVHPSQEVNKPNIISCLNIRITVVMKRIFRVYVSVFSDQDFRDKARILLYNGLFSFLCACITDNIILTGVYILCTIFFSLCAMTWKYRPKKHDLTELLKKSTWIYWLFFIMVAVLPAIIRIGQGITNGEFVCSYEFVRNLAANLSGALTTCSILWYTSKFDKEWLKESSDTSLVENLLLVCFNAAFLNAVNYIQNNISLANIVNAIHLFLVVSVGAYNALILLVLITSKKSLDMSPTQMYPRATLLCAFLFLLSYGLPMYLQSNETEKEWILFIFDCIALLIAAWYVLYCICRRTEGKYEEYPWIALFSFSFVVIAIAIIFPAMSEQKNSTEAAIKLQCISGIVILLGISFGMYLMNKRLKKNYPLKGRDTSLSD